MLNTFFRINMPYGMSKTKNNEWYFFNREYLPLGETDRDKFEHDWYENVEHIKYKGITEKKLWYFINEDGDNFKRDEETGNFKTIWFYRSGDTIPTISDKYWKKYIKNLKLITKLEVKTNILKSFRNVCNYKKL